MEALRIILLVFFATHIPATLLVDAQAVLPPRLVPRFAKDLLAWHIRTTGDPIMTAPFPAWLRALILGELLFQLPFFFAAVYAFATRKNWIRMPALVYGVHTATTLLPILLEIAESPKVPTPAARAQLLALYAPYAVLPALCAAWMASSPQPFKAAGAAAASAPAPGAGKRRSKLA
jgi:hypothetical protein